MKIHLALLMALVVTSSGFAAKKDFKGLFGSYRREKFTENEARSNDFGMDLLLSTLLPFTPLMKSSESRSAPNYVNPSYSTFFNLELGLHYSLGYHWQIFTNAGYYSYETRKENTVSQSNPLFHHFELTAFPVLLGMKYRFSTSDIVPYLGVGGGISFVKRRGFYDSSTTQFVENSSRAPTGQVLAGVEFYFHPRMGIRLEAAAYFMKLDPVAYDSGVTDGPTGTGQLPLLELQGSTWAMRYASGLFYLF